MLGCSWRMEEQDPGFGSLVGVLVQRLCTTGWWEMMFLSLEISFCFLPLAWWLIQKLKLKISQNKPGDNPHELFSLASLWVRLFSPHMKQELPQDTNTQSWWLGCCAAAVCISCAQLQPRGINIAGLGTKFPLQVGQRGHFLMKCYFIGKSWLGIISVSGRKSFVYKTQFLGKCIEILQWDISLQPTTHDFFFFFTLCCRYCLNLNF